MITTLEIDKCLKLHGPSADVRAAAEQIRHQVTVAVTVTGPFRGCQFDMLPPAFTQYAYRAAADAVLRQYPNVTVTHLDQLMSHIA